MHNQAFWANKCRIILRAFQGIGAAGTYSLCNVIYFEIIPQEKYAVYSAVLAAILGGGLVLGPVLGGVINNYTTWRWIFLFKYTFSSFYFPGN